MFPLVKGNRLIQGIVVDLEETTLAAQDQELKSDRGGLRLHNRF